MRIQHERAARAARESPKASSRRLPPIQTLAGAFVNKWLQRSHSAVDREQETKAAVSKILYAATGFTNDTAPPSIPFPPERIFLDLDAIEEIAGGFVDERTQAVGDAVRRAYSEMKSRHDEIKLSTQQAPPNKNALEARHKREIMALRSKHDQEIQSLQNEHKVQMASLKGKLNSMKGDVDKLREQADQDRREHSTSVEALVQAGLSTLRSIRRRKRGQ